ncbi:MAG: ureidoglycolate lyase [Chitinophagales bacterium]|nr:ureidoglycolate lyase [Chitinophagales bacterium]
MSQPKFNSHPVPIKLATTDSLKGFGRIVTDFESAEVEIVTWPAPEWRPVVPGTGNEGGITQGDFEMEWRGEVLHALNHAVNRSYITGWSVNPSEAREDTIVHPSERKFLYTHEANYHPDGGQIFFSRNNEPFVALLALPGDDITPESFHAFYFDGSFGIHINPGVWHQPLFPINNRVTFNDKQGKVHACIACNFVEEFGVYLQVSLLKP